MYSRKLCIAVFSFFASLFSVLFLSCGTGQDEYRITSPDNRIVVTVEPSAGEDTQALFAYSVSLNGKEIVAPSLLRITTGEATAWEVKKVVHSTVEEDYTLPLGKTSRVHSFSNKMIVSLQNSRNESLNVVFRVFDDGVAFRYAWPGGKEGSPVRLEIKDEHSQFNITGDPQATVLCFPNYTSSHETNYTAGRLSTLPNDTLIDLPALFELPDKAFVAITEADLKDYPGMYLSKNEKGGLYSKLSPHPDGSGVKAYITAPHTSPWRVIMIGETPATLLESNIVLNLSEPCKVEDLSWIKPNKSTWPWWCSTGVPHNAGFKRGMNFETMKYYIDFAAEHGIPCHSLTDVDGDSWYTSPLDTYPRPGEGTDVTLPNPGLQMDKLLEYARSKQIRIRLWVHWKALEPKLEEAFALYEKWGIEGLMVDYMDRDDQEMVNFYHRVMESAARHRLTIQFHGAYKPTGLRRTYPNLVTTEAVLNLEFNKWSNRCTSQHNVNVAFVRMLAGPLDYHLGGFHSVLPKDFVAQFKKPVVQGTRCHNMGMYVVYESYLQLLCDTPEAYTGQPGFNFLLQVPTTWDEMKVLKAEVGEYIVIARRSGTDWYIGGLNNSTPRELDIPLDFLSQGTFMLEKYTDSPTSDKNPDALDYGKEEVKGSSVLRLKMASGGGLAARISTLK